MKTKILCVLAYLYALNVSAFEFYQVIPDTIKPLDTIMVPEQDTMQVQEVSFVLDTISIEPPLIIYWSKKNAVGVNLNEVAFINWNAGGNNSVSALFHGNFERNFKKDLLSWKNRMGIRYGLNSQQGRELRKTDDEIVMSSTFGYRKDSVSNWNYSAKFNFNTQIAHGYRYPDTKSPISKFMAPGYMFLGIGSEYTSPDEDLTLYISPVTNKSTFVLDQRLANEGMFGVREAETDEDGNIIREGEKVRMEFGFLFTNELKKRIFPNVNLNHRLSLYSDYLNNFGNIDVDWELNVDLKVNDFIKANIGTHLRYDDDVKFKEDIDDDGELETLGARIQFKQLLGVGFVYEF